MVQYHLEKVAPWVNANLYELFQVKSHYISLKPDPDDELRVGLLKSYIDITYKSRTSWTHLSNDVQKKTIRKFNMNVWSWLNRKCPNYKLSHFNHVDSVIYGKELYPTSPPLLKCTTKACRCDDNCLEDCLNRNRRIECDEKCNSGQRCTNKESQSLFDWKQLMDLRYIDTVKGVGIFARTAIDEGTYLGEVTGQAVPENADRAKNDTSNKYLFGTYCRPGDPLWLIDTTELGNHTRFINHCCAPNAATVPWTAAGRTIIKAYAIKDISMVS